MKAPYVVSGQAHPGEVEQEAGRIYILLLNWNGWQDTIECLESVFRLDYPNIRIVVCDNASADQSLSHIEAWARGETLAGCANPQLAGLSLPPYPKPIEYEVLDRDQAERSNTACNARFKLIQTGANLGFAGGNNVGLRHALSDPACQFVWLLNNDTVVPPDALTALIRFMQAHPLTGLCGSLNLSYSSPAEVQAQGGKLYNRWTGRVRSMPHLMRDDLTSGPHRLDYINGASMLASRQFLEKVGLMEESYFLYFEELDWAMRARGKFALGYAPESIVYHKEGAAIGSDPDRMKRSLLSERYLSRNRVLFTRRFVPWALPSVLATVVAAAAYRLLKGDRERAAAMLSSMVRGLFGVDLAPGSA